ncbi:MAG: hypothetical protein ABI821_07035 [Pseudomonadota bacterium]
MDFPTLQDVIGRLREAGGFGDGVDVGPPWEGVEKLGADGTSADQKLAASLAVLSSLAEAVDNTSWKDASVWQLAKRVETLKGTGAFAPECEASVIAFFENESRFWTELGALYKKIVLSGS